MDTDNSIDYEDFLPNVRKSLYAKSVSTKSNSNGTIPNSKKIRLDISNVPNDKIKKPKSEKLKNRKATPFKRKIKKGTDLLNGNSSMFSPTLRKPKAELSTRIKKGTRKKKQVVISCSSDSVEEELSPSKSELDTFETNIIKSLVKKPQYFDTSDSSEDEIEVESSEEEIEIESSQDGIEIESSESEIKDSSEDEEPIKKFDLEAFFDSCDIGDLNESVTEAHSGINHEFLTDYAKNVKIVESESLYDRFDPTDEIDENDSSNTRSDDFLQNYEPEVNEEQITSIATEVKESVVSSDENNKEIQNSTIVSDSLSEFDQTDNSIDSEERQQSQQEEFDSSDESAYYSNFEDKTVVVLKENQYISFHGFFTLKVLYGKIEVLGSILDNNSSAVNIYSLRGSALLRIKNVTETDKYKTNEPIEISRLVSIRNDLQNTNDVCIKPNDAVFSYIKLDDCRMEFLEKYVSYKIFPHIEKDNVAQVVFEPTENVNVVKENPLWDKILNDVTVNTKLMIAGGKGVGKSTLLRFAINRLLVKFEKVKVLDLDPGQSEFAVPGCISVVTVTDPVLGPNFSHLQRPDRSLLSNINVAHDPKAYINCVKSLVDYLKTEEDCPILINYMGFVHGIGLNIITSVIKLIKPTDIIQIQSKSSNKNFRVDLNYAAVEENCKLFSGDCDTCVPDSELSYNLHKVPAMSEEKNAGWSLDPRQSREMCVLAYFGQMMQNGVNLLTSHGVPMYEIKLSEIKITNLQGVELHPAAANAAMVALCSFEREFNVFVCTGYGVIRGIDVENNYLVLITPEPLVVLEDVCYLVVGSVTLPPSIYMTPDDITGAVPYVMEGELVSLGQITKRSYLPANKK